MSASSEHEFQGRVSGSYPERYSGAVRGLEDPVVVTKSPKI